MKLINEEKKGSKNHAAIMKRIELQKQVEECRKERALLIEEKAKKRRARFQEQIKFFKIKLAGDLRKLKKRSLRIVALKIKKREYQSSVYVNENEEYDFPNDTDELDMS